MAGVGEGSGQSGYLGWSKQRGYGRAAAAALVPSSPVRRYRVGPVVSM